MINQFRESVRIQKEQTAIKIQSVYRSYKCKKYLDLHKSFATKIQAQWRRYLTQVDTAHIKMYMLSVIEINQLFTEIWPKYDIDGSGTVEANKTRIMFQDFTETKDINKKEVHDFLVKVDKDGNGTLEQEELVHFIVEGLQMTEDEMTDYASRGHFNKLIIDFFHGIQDAKNILLRDGKDGLRTYFYNKKTMLVD